MILAISLVKAVPDHEKVVYTALKDVKGVKNLYHIFGEHDFFLMLEAENMNNLTGILDDIKDMRYVGSIKSILVAPASRRSMNKTNIHNFSVLAA
jgi:DNA-binding Lrp family transcriptional regulator